MVRAGVQEVVRAVYDRDINNGESAHLAFGLRIFAEGLVGEHGLWNRISIAGDMHGALRHGNLPTLRDSRWNQMELCLFQGSTMARTTLASGFVLLRSHREVTRHKP